MNNLLHINMLRNGSYQSSLPEYWEDPSTLVSDQKVWFAHRQTSNVWENPTIENFVEDENGNIVKGMSFPQALPV